MKEISPEEFKQLSLDILVFVDDFCRKNSIQYFLAFGTLIGAIRHKGMIPWDDDIDIMMPRDDYNRFVHLMQQQKGKTIYQINCFETDPEFYLPWARVCNNTTILQNRPHRIEKDLGVWIDVFPIDNAPSIQERQRWYKEYNNRRAKIWHTIPTPFEKFSFKKQVLTLELFWRIIYGVRNFSKYRDAFVKYATKYNDIETDEVMIPCTIYQLRAVFPKELFSKDIDVEYEKYKFKAPIGYDTYLRTIYGDYMQFPPEEKRQTHHHFTAYYK